MTKILNFGLKIKGGGVVGRVAHAKFSDPVTPQNLKRVPAETEYWHLHHPAKND